MVSFNNVSMLVPHKNGEFYRDKNWEWLRKLYKKLMPGIEICIGDTNSNPYCKSEAVNNAFKKATREILIIMDSDILINVEYIKLAINMLDKYKFILPYNRLIRLDKESTDKILKKEFIKLDDIDIGNSRIVENESSMVGGIYITTKEVYKNIGGFDERFKGWGKEDDAVLSCIKYAYEQYYRTNNSIYHMYHTRQHKTLEYSEKNLNILRGEYLNRKKINDTIKYLKIRNGFK